LNNRTNNNKKIRKKGKTIEIRRTGIVTSIAKTSAVTAKLTTIGASTTVIAMITTGATGRQHNRNNYTTGTIEIGLTPTRTKLGTTTITTGTTTGTK